MTVNLEYAKILYPLDPEIFNKRFKYLSINTGDGGIIDILSRINFYPCYVPLDQSLITLSITSENLLGEIKRMLEGENQIVYANLHKTKRENDYVSYGQLYSAKVDESIYSIYNYELWLGLVLDRPHLMNKFYENREYLVPISGNRYFHLKNNFHSSVFESDFSYSNMLIEITKDSYRESFIFSITYLGKRVELMSLWCNAIQYHNGITKSRISLAIKKDDYKKIYETDVGLKIASIYTMYNIRRGDKEIRPLNLVTNVYSLKNSYEELALFIGDIEVSNGLTEKIEVDMPALKKLASELYGISSSMEVRMELPASRVHSEYSKLTILLIKPEIIIKLITAYILTSNASIKNVLKSDDVYSSVIDFYNRIENSVFDANGNLIPPDIRKFLLT